MISIFMPPLPAAAAHMESAELDWISFPKSGSGGGRTNNARLKKLNDATHTQQSQALRNAPARALAKQPCRK